MKFFVEPWAHQMKAIKECRNRDSYALLWDMGTGKTGGMINILRQKFNQKGRVMNTLILTPLATIQNWKREFHIHSRIPQSQIFALNESNKRAKELVRASALKEAGIIIITNYEALTSIACWNLLMGLNFDVLVCDEAHMIKDPKAKRSKLVAQIADRARCRYIMTGTPILNSPQDIFWPWRVMDLGKRFGKNFFQFRAKYFKDLNSSWAGRPNYFPKFVISPLAMQTLRDEIKKDSSRILKKDCLDLPPYVVLRRDVGLSAEQLRMYKEMEKNFVAWIDTQDGTKQAIVAQLAMTKAMRLQQIACGIYATEGGGEKVMLDVPRLNLLRELLESVVHEHKVIIWCTFKGNYVQCGHILDQMKIKHTFLTGEQSGKEKEAAMDSFRKDPDMKVIVANRKAGGVGVNLIEASYSIVLSRDMSLAAELQSEARNYRGGSEMHEKITRIDICATGTIDELIVDRLTQKQEVSSAIVDWAKSKSKGRR